MDLLEDFFSNLDGAIPKEKVKTDNAKSNYAKKVHMNAPPYQGRLEFVPFPSKDVTEGYQAFLKGVKQVKFKSKSDDKTSRWHRILAKSEYGELTSEESNLYDLVSTKFDEFFKLERKTNKSSWKTVAIASYALMYGIHQSLKDPIEAKDLTSEGVPKKGDPCLYIFKHKYIAKEIKSALAMQSSAIGSKSWILKVFNNSTTKKAVDGTDNRVGSVLIDFYQKADAPGYTTGVRFNFDTQFVPAIPNDWSVEESKVETFRGLVNSFIGWQGDWENNKRFSTKTFNSILSFLTNSIIKKTAPVAPPVDPTTLGDDTNVPF